jgi:phosphomevalonate kinase
MLNPKEMIDALILTGALEISAMDSETGEMVFAVTEKMEELAPEIYKEIVDQAHKDVMSLWAKGLLVMDVASESPEVCPSEEALDRANWLGLSNSEYSMMNTVMRMFEGGI